MMNSNLLTRCTRSALAAFLVFGSFLGAYAQNAPTNPQNGGPKGRPQGKTAPSGILSEMRTIAPPTQGDGTKAAPEVLAEVNGKKIEKKEIVQEAFRQHYKEILDNRIKIVLIESACKANNITISREEEEAEILKMAGAFGFTSQEWLDTILSERGISPEVYRSDIIRPLLAIRKLAGTRLQISEADVEKEFQAAYGPSVQLRQIVHDSRSEMEKIRENLSAHPDVKDLFATEAKNSSVDPASAAYGGMIRPIRKHTTPPEIEQAVFALNPGEISEIIEWPQGNFILFQCVEHFPEVPVNREEVREALTIKVRDAKTREVSEQVFTELQNRANIQDVLNDPNLSKQFPQLAARVNGTDITRQEIARYCFERYGEVVLAERISILILEQECVRRKIEITENDINREIYERAAEEMPLMDNGKPNVKLWMDTQAKNLNIPVAAFRMNTVRPLVMLKKLSQSNVEVSEEAIRKAFVSRYGPRVKALAIFFNNMRVAQQVWGEANQIRNPDHFGDLAAKYSVHGPSKALRGEIKPIQQHGGMPTLEKAAFALKPGELSEVIQLGNEEYVVLFCMGHTEPVVKNIEDVREIIREDLVDAFLQVEMQKTLQIVYNKSAITNYMTGQSKTANIAAEQAPDRIQR